MIGKLFAHLRQQWLGALAVVLVLTGGTAYALDGSNTVFSDDIVNNEVRTADLKDANLTTVDIRGDAVTTGKIADGTIRDDDLEGVEFLRTKTLRLQDPTAGGSGAGGLMMTIGRVDLVGSCAKAGDGTLRAAINPVVDEPGAVLVQGDFVVELVPFDVQFLAGAVSATDDPPLDGNEGSFAILDSEQASVTGVAAATVDRDTDRCVVSVHAMG